MPVNPYFTVQQNIFYNLQHIQVKVQRIITNFHLSKYKQLTISFADIELMINQ